MADRTITSDLIVAVDGSDEINVTVSTITLMAQYTSIT